MRQTFAILQPGVGGTLTKFGSVPELSNVIIELKEQGIGLEIQASETETVCLFAYVSLFIFTTKHK